MTVEVEFDGDLPFDVEFAEYMIASVIPKDAVKFVPQELSEQDQEQARKNIGAMPAGVQSSVDISTSGVDVEGVSLQTEIRKSGVVALQHYTGGFVEAAEYLTVLGNVANGERDTDAASVGQVREMISENACAETDEKYFDIDYDGVVSLKPEYRADGEKNAELPEILVIPEVIGNTAVSAFVESMFDKNLRVKSVTIPSHIRTLPKKFANKTYNLIEINGTENVETICQAAFQYSSIRKAMFPKLKNLDGGGQFNGCPFLTIADIGSVTAISISCFSNNDSLSLVMGGTNVKTIRDKSFFSTRSLKNLPIVSNVTSIGTQAFVLSRVNYDWWTFKTSSGCAFGTDATPAHFNPSQWWTNCTYTACENPLGSTFHQHNPEWDTTTILNASNTYGDGCVVVSAAHIYSALTGVKFDSPQYFVENIVGGIDNGRLLAPTGGTTYQGDDIATWLTALGLKCEKLTGGYNSANLQRVYDELKEGALIFTGVNPGHAGVIFGVAENGEVLTLDSCPALYAVGVYEAKTFQQPISSLVTAGQGVIIVKKEEN